MGGSGGPGRAGVQRSRGDRERGMIAYLTQGTVAKDTTRATSRRPARLNGTSDYQRELATGSRIFASSARACRSTSNGTKSRIRLCSNLASAP